MKNKITKKDRRDFISFLKKMKDDEFKVFMVIVLEAAFERVKKNIPEKF